ncbi:MAG: hypothetical protein ACXVBH_03040, partial [Flavisolibacter sp.]
GNFYGVTPYEGRYDALQPTLFSFDKTRSNFNSQMLLPGFEGEVRDTKWIHSSSGGRLLIVGRNNAELSFLKPVQ